MNRAAWIIEYINTERNVADWFTRSDKLVSTRLLGEIILIKSPENWIMKKVALAAARRQNGSKKHPRPNVRGDTASVPAGQRRRLDTVAKKGIVVL